MKKRVRAVIIENGKILLIHRVKNNEEYWVFPGGGIEPSDKNPETALQRECREELGTLVRVKPVFFEDEDETFFVCDITEGDLGTGKGPEFEKGTFYQGTYQLEWLPIDLLDGYRVLPDVVKKKLEDHYE